VNSHAVTFVTPEKTWLQFSQVVGTVLNFFLCCIQTPALTGRVLACAGTEASERGKYEKGQRLIKDSVELKGERNTESGRENRNRRSKTKKKRNRERREK
jgi:hypothetical protein